MSNKPFTLTTPSAFQCYDCTGCGECCRGRFAIIISRADRDRIVGQQWSEEELGLAGQRFFIPRGDNFQLAHRDDGACIFLNDDGKCRIHARFGEPAKPLACRLYPFRFVPLGSQVRVDVRFDCPATSSNYGRPITGHRAALMGLLGQVIPERAATLPPPPLYGNVQVTWAQLCRISETFERLLMENSLDLTRRVIGCVNLAALLRSPRIVTLEGRKLSELLETVSEKVIAAAAKDALPRVAPAGSVRLSFRQLAGVYGRIDQVGEKARPFERLKHGMRMAAGKGTIPPLRHDLPEIDFAEIEEPMALTNAAAATLERYLHLRLTSMSFFGRTFYNRSYLDGMNALLLTYPLSCWFARVFARGNGLAEIDAACAEKALFVVDHQHGITPVLDMPTERFRAGMLCDRSNLRALAIWYGS